MSHLSPTERQCSSSCLPALAAVPSFAKVFFFLQEEAEVAGCHLKVSVGFQNELFDFVYMSGWRGFCPVLINYCWIVPWKKMRRWILMMGLQKDE